MDKFGEALPIETKAILEKDIPIGEETFELFKDFDMHGGEFYYLVLPSGGKMLGFLANFQGDLIDLKGEVLTPLVQLNSILMDQDFNEYEDGANGILVRQIELAEIVPEEVIGGEIPEIVEEGEISDDDMVGEESLDDFGEELPLPEGIPVPEEIDEGEIKACHQCSGRIDGCVHQQVPQIVKQPCFYDKPVPYPVYRKKIIPYNVIQ